ncbi:MAG: VWA domain-containing protein [Thermoanaerobaculia bacterium]|nr:VWA domain-containing protein [Thermoanaerobaculia bacterium]MBP9824446.1 VWA domain-containing protein [Thermoanaerobaculia bacterium]
MSPRRSSRRLRRVRQAVPGLVRLARIPLLTLLLLGMLAPAAAVGQAPPALAIVSPVAGVPAFGAIEVVVEPSGISPRRMEFWFNGIKAGELTRPPWKLTIDTGEENIERRFRVVATAAGGQRVEMEAMLPEIHVDDELDLPLQQLYITATSAGATVDDLPRDGFKVFDSGRRQQLVTFEHGDVPLTAVLLIDSSLSMAGAPLRAALAGAHSFASGMAELDEAMLLLFADRVAAHTAWSDDPDELLSGLEGVEARGGSAVNDHLFLALQLLEKRQGRRVVILLSDGVDVESLLHAAEVHEIAVRSQALVYWIRASAEPFDLLVRSAWRNVVEHSTEIRQLDATVAASGGRRIDIQRFEDAADAFQQILTELREQYVLGFYPDRVRHNGTWHPLRIEVDAKGVELRTRDGYFDD